MGHPVPVGRVGAYLLSKSLQHAYGAGILGGYVEGLVNSPTSLDIVGGYISSVHKIDVPWALMGGVASGLRNRSGYIGAYIIGHPAAVQFCEQHDRTLVKANSENTIGQGLNIDSVVTFKGVNSSDFYAQLNWINTQNAEFKAKAKVIRYKRPPLVTITSVSPNIGGLVNGARQVTVTATGTLVDGNRWTHAYIDFGDPLSSSSPIRFTNNASISGFSLTNPVWTAVHDYHSSGIYKIIARAQDDYGMIGSDASGVNLAQGLVAGTDYPYISITATPRNGTVPTSLQVNFTATTSGTAFRGGLLAPADSRILWNFGNRESSQNRAPVTHYNSPGLYVPTCRFRYVNPSGTVIYVQDSLLLGFNV
jgi:PKD repeat protein